MGAPMTPLRAAAALAILLSGLSAGGCFLGSSRPPTGEPPPEVGSTEPAPPAPIRDTIHQHMGKVRFCYEKALTHQPELTGEVRLRFVIDREGRVEKPEVVAATLPDPEVGRCLVRALADIRFPPPTSGVAVTVTYPFVFKTE